MPLHPRDFNQLAASAVKPFDQKPKIHPGATVDPQVYRGPIGAPPPVPMPIGVAPDPGSKQRPVGPRDMDLSRVRRGGDTRLNPWQVWQQRIFNSNWFNRGETPPEQMLQLLQAGLRPSLLQAIQRDRRLRDIFLPLIGPTNEDPRPDRPL